MFNRIAIITIIGVILWLAISALNISNDAINSLTMESKDPVLSCNIVGQDLSLFILGKNYIYSGEVVISGFIKLRNYTLLAYDEIYNYLYRIWDIFQTVFSDG